jgi:hypothetical protein
MFTSTYYSLIRHYCPHDCLIFVLMTSSQTPHFFVCPVTRVLHHLLKCPNFILDSFREECQVQCG